MGQTIGVDEAEGYIYGDSIAVQDVSDHRWYTRQLVVFERDGALMGFHYDEPKTELQEGMDCFDAVPVPIFPVVGREVTTTVYERAE